MIYRIREARSRDREAISNLWLKLIQHHEKLDARFTVPHNGWRTYLQSIGDLIHSRSGHVLVAENERAELVAYLTGSLQQREKAAHPGIYGFIHDMYVEPNWRMIGVGRDLFEHMRHWMESERAVAIEVYVAEMNNEATNFWTEMGCRPYLRLMQRLL